MEKVYKCPECGEKQNLSFDYDYSKQHRPVSRVWCISCGEVFDGDIPVTELTKQIDYPELEGTLALCNDIINSREISDEEIMEAAYKYAEVYQCPTEIKMCKHDVVSAWNKAIQWYKEQIRIRNEKK